MTIGTDLRRARDTLNAHLSDMHFAPPVTHVYNPMQYAAAAWDTYVERYARPECDVVFLGMNPGPWGMVQTGIPFGEVAAVRGWLGITDGVSPPDSQHPKRPVTGLACTRSEVSGRRLWGLFSERFVTADAFFARHFVTNYCPLAFLAESGRNITPDRLPAAERESLFDACDVHLRSLVAALSPAVVIGIGAFAAKRARAALADAGVTVVQILHPSPASPAANRGWAEQASHQLVAAGIW